MAITYTDIDGNALATQTEAAVIAAGGGYAVENGVAVLISAQSSSQSDQDAKIAEKSSIELATVHADDDAFKAANTEDAIGNVAGTVKLYDADTDTVRGLADTYEDVDQFYPSVQALRDARTAVTDKTPFEDQTSQFGILAADGSYTLYRWDTVSDFAPIAQSATPLNLRTNLRLDGTATDAEPNSEKSIADVFIRVFGLLGLPVTAADLGTFPLNTLSDNLASFKAALTELEGKLETIENLGDHLGSFATVAAMPTGVNVKALDWVFLTAVDGANQPGIWVYDGTTWNLARQLTDPTAGVVTDVGDVVQGIISKTWTANQIKEIGDKFTNGFFRSITANFDYSAISTNDIIGLKNDSTNGVSITLQTGTNAVRYASIIPNDAPTTTTDANFTLTPGACVAISRDTDGSIDVFYFGRTELSKMRGDNGAHQYGNNIYFLDETPGAAPALPQAGLYAEYRTTIIQANRADWDGTQTSLVTEYETAQEGVTIRWVQKGASANTGGANRTFYNRQNLAAGSVSSFVSEGGLYLISVHIGGIPSATGQVRGGAIVREQGGATLVSWQSSQQYANAGNWRKTFSHTFTIDTTAGQTYEVLQANPQGLVNWDEWDLTITPINGDGQSAAVTSVFPYSEANTGPIQTTLLTIVDFGVPVPDNTTIKLYTDIGVAIGRFTDASAGTTAFSISEGGVSNDITFLRVGNTVRISGSTTNGTRQWLEVSAPN